MNKGLKQIPAKKPQTKNTNYPSTTRKKMAELTFHLLLFKPFVKHTDGENPVY